MLDVHPPHTPTHGWRDFFIHLFTITIGLLIALSLEGLVEWQHHRHLVHDAEISLHDEIKKNSAGMADTLKQLQQEQADLNHDMDVLHEIATSHKIPKDKRVTVSYAIHSFDDVSWKTAQATEALSYMPYADAKEYDDIYSTQTKLNELEGAAAHDAAIALSSFYAFGDDKDPPPTPAQVDTIREKISALQGQLLIVDSFMKGLNGGYNQFLKAHPGTA